MPSKNTSTASTTELNFVTANRFYVGLESTISASFTECQGLGVKVKYETFLEGGVNDQQRTLLGQPEFSEVTLKRGLTDDLVFWDWLKQVLKTDGNAIVRRNVNIVVFNQAGETMQCWTLIGAIPVSWKAPSLTADANSIAIEELTLIHEGIKVAKRSGAASATSLKGRKNGYFVSN